MVAMTQPPAANGTNHRGTENTEEETQRRKQEETSSLSSSFLPTSLCVLLFVLCASVVRSNPHALQPKRLRHRRVRYFAGAHVYALGQPRIVRDRALEALLRQL